jgi:glycerol transport system substrate-binding protein
MKRRLMATAASAVLMLAAGSALANMEAARRWVDNEFQPSTLSKEEQMKEMEWFIKAAEPFKGMEISVVT